MFCVSGASAFTLSLAVILAANEAQTTNLRVLTQNNVSYKPFSRSTSRGEGNPVTLGPKDVKQSKELSFR
jgi:hypothetical protein